MDNYNLDEINDGLRNIAKENLYISNKCVLFVALTKVNNM